MLNRRGSSGVTAYAIAIAVLLAGNPIVAADAESTGSAQVLLACESAHEGVRSLLELREKIATLTIQPSDGKSYVCTAPPRITDGRKAVNPHFVASFRLARCAPELPAELAVGLRAAIDYRLTLFDRKSTLAWITQSAAKDCAVKVNNFETFFLEKVSASVN